MYEGCVLSNYGLLLQFRPQTEGWEEMGGGGKGGLNRTEDVSLQSRYQAPDKQGAELCLIILAV